MQAGTGMHTVVIWEMLPLFFHYFYRAVALQPYPERKKMYVELLENSLCNQASNETWNAMHKNDDQLEQQAVSSVTYVA